MTRASTKVSPASREVPLGPERQWLANSHEHAQARPLGSRNLLPGSAAEDLFELMRGQPNSFNRPGTLRKTTLEIEILDVAPLIFDSRN